MPVDTDKLKSQVAAAFARQERYAGRIARLYEQYTEAILKLVNSYPGIDPTKEFSFAKYPALQRKVDAMLRELSLRVLSEIQKGIQDEWEESNKVNDAMVRNAFGAESMKDPRYQRFFDRNLKAMIAFMKRIDAGGMGLSDRIWKYSGDLKAQMDAALNMAITEGKSADEISRLVRGYLKEPDKLFRRVRDKKGILRLSKAAKAYRPGPGNYRSAYKNAMRVARTETNMAYRMADHTRYQQLDFVVGYEVKLSKSHPIKMPMGDICDELKGKYPKDFKFPGWHPQCYSDDTEVLTDRGWLLFKDVQLTDKIFSLNPDTWGVEYVRIVKLYEYHHTGDMVQFHNRSLDLLVTPDHKMVYLSKSDGAIRTDKMAGEYDLHKGALYRSSCYNESDIQSITIGEHTINFDSFCEFMAYYLADGSLSWTRNYQLFIARHKEKRPVQYEKIRQMLSMMPFMARPAKYGFYINDRSMYEYLKQFGKSPNKHVPKEIKLASKKQIRIFLDAYVKCDGHIKESHEFIGNKGGICVPDHPEKIFFTCSNQMAADIGELLVKIGKRPSYKIQKSKGVSQQHRNGIYYGNYDCWRISECHSETATVFKKSIQQYDGLVYDLQLEKNHILYVRRNGRCVWGSNCMCYVTSVMMTDDEFWAMQDKILAGEPTSGMTSANQVTDVPDGFKKWIAANQKRAEGWKSQPYFIRDNFKGGRIEGGLKFKKK